MLCHLAHKMCYLYSRWIRVQFNSISYWKSFSFIHINSSATRKRKTEKFKWNANVAKRSMPYAIIYLFSWCNSISINFYSSLEDTLSGWGNDRKRISKHFKRNWFFIFFPFASFCLVLPRGLRQKFLPIHFTWEHKHK